MKTKVIFFAIILIACFFTPIFSFAQNDTLANGYGVGSFNHRVIFPIENKNIALVSSGGKDILVLKYDSLGNLAWVRQAGGKYDDEGIESAVDDSGNVYITGYFSDTATFYQTTFVSVDAKDFFLAKYNEYGDLMWVVHTGGIGDDIGLKITLDKKGNLLVTESIAGKVIFNGKEIKKNKDGTVVATYSPGGKLLSME